MEFLGIDFDREINNRTKGSSGVTKLSTDASKVQIYMIPTNEELVIARDTEKIVSEMK
jgi:acetate kinase